MHFFPRAWLSGLYFKCAETYAKIFFFLVKQVTYAQISFNRKWKKKERNMLKLLLIQALFERTQLFAMVSAKACCGRARTAETVEAGKNED